MTVGCPSVLAPDCEDLGVSDVDEVNAVPLVSGADVEAAARLLDGVVRRTPLEHSRALAERVGGPVGLKCENLQRGGAVKIRGAYTPVARPGRAGPGPAG